MYDRPWPADLEPIQKIKGCKSIWKFVVSNHYTLVLSATLCKGGINELYLPPDDLLFAVEPLLPEPRRKPGGRGRPPVNPLLMFCAIFYVLRTGIQWKALPRCLGAGSTAHLYFQKWVEAGVFHSLWKLGLLEAQLADALDFSFMSIDGAMTKAPLGGESTGPNPTDRGKEGTKRHLLTEGSGLPIGLTVTGANVHDIRQVEAVLESMPFLPPDYEPHCPHGFCADKGYESEAVRTLIWRKGYADHIRSRCEEKDDKKMIPGYRARRWVCERTHSWMNRYRRILVRWEKKTENYLALLHLICAIMLWKATGLFSG
jgi:putative transposase